ncbi:hypothetical protein O3M35_010349 [Rhynocoris fuscipes]|uniref:Uncharacterized protein n=1 Tax=Rhynocoris fuscipes TaxID=488301 RepID=A0AAW1D402_9HEMI
MRNTIMMWEIAMTYTVPKRRLVRSQNENSHCMWRDKTRSFSKMGQLHHLQLCIECEAVSSNKTYKRNAWHSIGEIESM